MKHTRIFEIDSDTILEITVSLADTCGNGYSVFNVSCNYYVRRRSSIGDSIMNYKGRNYVYDSCGVDISDITKYWVEILPILKLGGCDVFGLPSYPIMNGLYWINHNLDYAVETFRLSVGEGLIVSKFKRLSWTSYIVNNLLPRYEAEVTEAIGILEGLCGVKYVKVDMVSPVLYNDMNYCYVTEKKGWNVYKGNADKIKEYPV
jgi:hypothetical protein